MRRKILVGAQFLSLDSGAVVGTCAGDLGENGVAVKGNNGTVFVVARSLITATVSYGIPYAPDKLSVSGGSPEAAEPGEITKSVAAAISIKPTDENVPEEQKDKPPSVSGRRKMPKDYL